MAVTFESMERRMPKIEKCLAEYGIASLEEARELCNSKGFDAYDIVKGVQPIAFENAGWAYTLGCAVAIKKGVKTAAEAAECIGIGLEAFCIPGSVAEQRNVGRGHGNLGAMLLRDETKCFAFLAGHESFAAAEGAIGIARNANKARKEPLKVILNGLGKDAAYIISRINGFTYVKTQFDYFTSELKIVEERAFSDGERAAVRCYGAQTMFVKALLSCSMRMLAYLLQVTQLTQLVSSTSLQVHTRSGLSRTELSISQLLQAAVQAVHFTLIIWVQALLHTVLQTQWAECMATLSLQVHLQFLLTLR